MFSDIVMCTVGNKGRTDSAANSRDPRRSVVSFASVKSECDSVNFQVKNRPS